MVLRKAPSPRFPNTMHVMFSSLATLQMASPGVPSSILLLQGTYKLENVSRINKTLTEKNKYALLILFGILLVLNVKLKPPMLVISIIIFILQLLLFSVVRNSKSLNLIGY